MRAPKALEAYRAKRDFAATREPSGDAAPRKKTKSGLSFVVQKHAARRLHYDFRLELDGVLKSWAVAKGPSLVAGEKRLAVHVEDHPLDYGGFEGTIPQGQYGAGSVIVWDRGIWIPDADPHKGYAKGHLSFALEGEKLKGGWHLVRMAARPGERGDNWLLIKADDSFARKPGDADVLEDMPRSVSSGKSIEAIARDKSSRTWTSGRAASPQPAAPSASGLSPRQRARAPLAEDDVKAPRERVAAKRTKPHAGKASPDFEMPKGARRAKIPGFVEPCLATAATAPPSGAKFAHEIKFDGYRLQPSRDGERVVIYTRRGLDWTQRFPGIAAAIADLPVESAILDGEAVVEDSNGIADFAKLQDVLKTGRRDQVIFYAFDLLHLNGYDLRGAPLSERKALLAQVLDAAPENGVLRYSAHFDANGETMLRHVCALNAEGIVSKQIDKPYRSGRNTDWLKSKCANRQEFVVIGYTPSTATPQAIGSLSLGLYDDGKLRYAGRAGSGFDVAAAKDLFNRLEKIKREAPPVEETLPAEARRNVRWSEPKLVAEIAFRGWSGAHILRQASFKALRDDKAPDEVVFETPIVPEAASAAGRKPQSKAAPKPRSAPQSSVKLTHPGRVLWPQAGLTKEALADYYAAAWEFAGPHVVGRPLALVRCPTGVGHGCFFQKHQWEGAGEHVVLTEDPEDGKSLVSIKNLDGLIALVQASVLEIHPWGAKIDNLDAPDRLIFDLDPGDGVTWRDLVAAALDVRARLHDDGLDSFVKTSGGKGLHVVAPIAPKSSWDEAKAYCRALAGAMAAAAPDRLTATMAKRERSGRIYIDYLRNGRGATAVSAYSTRARPEAGISTPLDWSELADVPRADHYTLGNIARRLRALTADPWRDIAKPKKSLPTNKHPPPRLKH